MAFIADREVLRTYDSVRGIELKGAGGGSDGHYNFIIHPIGKPDEPLGGFRAREMSRYATDEEKRINPGVKGFSTWVIGSGYGGGRVFKGFTRDESRVITREAMLAFRSIRGLPIGPEWIFDVEDRF